ncbi:hypothetical protein HNR00_002500 [Methylorubrum rhodinum]|uniref:NYN domain-containing protein n=1 Tax=Methylorubrum rhodinum TaxID=29428 RepID=A0A840ZKV7_9HYPH|nr:hypothetical protein [Methylorubrum rhodinum]MBB5757784.1 hypothetical protein [Methylorubrum rhodinum]
MRPLTTPEHKGAALPAIGVTMKRTTALIDYDNIMSVKERSITDVITNLSEMIPHLVFKIQALVPDVEEVNFRLYGGWSLRDGQSSQQCVWLLSEMGRFNRRHGSVRAKCRLARELIAQTDLSLVGTYRDGGQKMVDGMITADLIHLSNDEEISLVLVSDDDDFVPGVITGSCLRSSKSPLIVLRPKRKKAEPLNDHHYKVCRVVTAEL